MTVCARNPEEKARVASRLSVVVLSYNRRDELRQTLSILAGQAPPGCELIVADNHSTDGTREMIEREFPRVKALHFEQNLGVEGRRKGAAAASGEIVVMYDDDSAPGDPPDLARIVSFFDAHPEAGAITTRVRRFFPGYDETWGWERHAVAGSESAGYEGLFLHGSGMAFRRTALLESDIFANGLFWGDEEWEAALNLISRGWRIYYLPSILTGHRASPLNRNRTRYFRYSVRNHLLTILRYFPAVNVLEYGLKEFLYQSLLSRAHFPAVLAGVWDFLRMAPAWYRLRRPVPASRRAYLEIVRKMRYPWPLAWFKQHHALRIYRGNRTLSRKRHGRISGNAGKIG